MASENKQKSVLNIVMVRVGAKHSTYSELNPSDSQGAMTFGEEGKEGQ